MINNPKLLLIDFDGTLTAPNPQGNGVVFNDALIAELVGAKQTGARLIGFTSYQIKFNLKMNLHMNNTRYQVIEACRERGLVFEEILTTASAYAETIKPEKYPFGQYYFNKIQPIEQEALICQTLEARERYIADHSGIEAKYLDKGANARVLELRQCYRQLDEEAYQKGKEEMFRYVREIFTEADIEVYDDSEAVIRVATHIGITAHHVQFMHASIPAVTPSIVNMKPNKPEALPDQKKSLLDHMIIKIFQGETKLNFKFGNKKNNDNETAQIYQSTKPKGTDVSTSTLAFDKN